MIKKIILILIVCCSQFIIALENTYITGKTIDKILIEKESKES
ncbi:hypothetical protein WPG_0059 [Winogradskyella sp. PG-2]|nr:hypothetical protein WPG_0059 [Winogradskyella sp. PG-2]